MNHEPFRDQGRLGRKLTFDTNDTPKAFALSLRVAVSVSVSESSGWACVAPMTIEIVGALVLIQLINLGD